MKPLKNDAKRSDRRRGAIRTCVCYMCKPYTGYARIGHRPDFDDTEEQLWEYYDWVDYDKYMPIE